jgi:hypothetical protein
MKNEKFPSDETNNPTQESVESARRDIEHAQREERWGGVETEPDKKYTRDGTVPHSKFAKEMESRGATAERRTILESETWSPERKDLDRKVTQLTDTYRKMVEERLAGDNPEEETEEETKERLEKAEFLVNYNVQALMNEGLYAALITEIPDEVYQTFPDYPDNMLAFGEHPTEAVHIFKTTERGITKNGVIRIQDGPYTASKENTPRRYRSRTVIKSAKQLAEGDSYDEKASVQDKVLYVSNSYGDPLTPENMGEDPQTVQFNEQEREITVRADRVGMVVLQRNETDVKASGMIESAEKRERLIVIATPEVEDQLAIKALGYVGIKLQTLINYEATQSVTRGQFVHERFSKNYFDQVRNQLNNGGVSAESLSEAYLNAAATLRNPTKSQEQE